MKRLQRNNLKLGGSGGWDYVNKHELNGGIGSFPNQRGNNAKFQAKRKVDIEFDNLWRQKIANSLHLYHTTLRPNDWKSHWIGKHHSEETKLKISETRKKNKSAVGSKNSNYGKCWIYNLEFKQSKSIFLTELDQYINNGWLRGRKIKW